MNSFNITLIITIVGMLASFIIPIITIVYLIKQQKSISNEESKPTKRHTLSNAYTGVFWWLLLGNRLNG